MLNIDFILSAGLQKSIEFFANIDQLCFVFDALTLNLQNGDLVEQFAHRNWNQNF